MCEPSARVVATLAQLEPLSQLRNGSREVPNGQVTLRDVCQHPFQVLLRKAARVLNLKAATRKILDEMGRNEQMTEGMQLPYVVLLAERILYASLQNGCVWLVEIALQMCGDDWFDILNCRTERLFLC